MSTKNIEPSGDVLPPLKTQTAYRGDGEKTHDKIPKRRYVVKIDDTVKESLVSFQRAADHFRSLWDTVNVTDFFEAKVAESTKELTAGFLGLSVKREDDTLTISWRAP